MKVTRILAALALVVGFAGTAHAQHGCARLSWGTCDPQVQDRSFTTAGPYLMVYSIFGSPDGNVGTDSQVRIRHLNEPGGSQAGTPDSWRFDDTGCQTGSQLTLTSNKALSKACPLYSGTNPLTITQFAMDVDGSMFMRLAITYDNFNPVATTRYTAWQITFDHTFSVAGPSAPDGSNCGGAELCENFSFDFAGVLGLDGIQHNIPDCDVAPAGTPANTEATWNGGCQGPVATAPVTWGKLKGMYH
jgi:hypothetical protein